MISNVYDINLLIRGQQSRSGRRLVRPLKPEVGGLNQSRTPMIVLTWMRSAINVCLFFSPAAKFDDQIIVEGSLDLVFWVLLKVP